MLRSWLAPLTPDPHHTHHISQELRMTVYTIFAKLAKQVWWHTIVILVLRTQRHDKCCKSETSLDYPQGVKIT